MRVLVGFGLLFLLTEAGPLPKKNTSFVDDGGEGEDDVHVLIENRGKPTPDELPENQEEDENLKDVTPPPPPSDEDAQKILQEFGFIKPGALSGLSDEDEDDAMTDAIKRYQSTMGIEETGVLDEETKGKLAAPRCGQPAVENFSEGEVKWQTTSLTYAIHKFTGDLDRNIVREVLRRAFAVWAFVTPLTFREVRPDGHSNIKIAFHVGAHGDNAPFDGRGNVAAHGFFPESGMLHFDDDERWVNADVRMLEAGTGTDLFETAIHEIGHVLGVSHIKTNKNAVMFPSLHPDTSGGRYHMPQLTRDDIAAIQRLYGPKRNGGGSRQRNGGEGRLAWRHGPWDSYFAFGCDLYGKDLYRFQVGDDANRCVRECYDSDGCFAWLRHSDGYCYLKGKFSVREAKATSDRGMICGAWF